jgi:hypothetical protein
MIMETTMKAFLGFFLSLTVILQLGTTLAAEESQRDWLQARKNGELARRAFLSCRDYVRGWLAHADPRSGLIPRNLTRDFYWNAQDAAADNYPFMVLTSALLNRELFEGRMKAMLEAERKLTTRKIGLPDDFLFRTQSFRRSDTDLSRLIFGASEYVKDGLLPLTEWLGPSLWSIRMKELVDAVLEQSNIETPAGLLPAVDHEVGGELMQALSRLAWMTGERRYRDMAFRLADYFLLHALPTANERLSLDDHGCEVIGGLAEAYVLAAGTDPERYPRYRERLYSMMDTILEFGCDRNGFFYMEINPVKGEILNDELTDNWGYDYNAFLTVAELDDHDPYRNAVRYALSNLPKVTGYPWEGDSADGYADSIESGLNLLNRIPVKEGFRWVDHETAHLMAKQGEDGVIAGWHGDGNYARTLQMYALWKTQGCRIEPWRADVSFGAITSGEEVLISLHSRWPWRGKLIFDRPRHRDTFRLPFDYPRLNQFPEWFTVEAQAYYRIENDGTLRTLHGGELLEGIPVELKGDSEGAEVRIRVGPQSR